MESRGAIRKMRTAYDPSSGSPVQYALPLGEASLDLNPLLGKTLKLLFKGSISCVNCGRSIKKTFAQGYCFPCYRKLAECDSCVVKPELCHYHAGTCREPQWGETHCFIPHTVYLANSSGVKVGITRGLDPQPRWIDQGAFQGLAIRTAASRLESGQVEVALKQFVADKTDWRKMLKGAPEPADLEAERARLFECLAAESPDAPLPGSPPDAPASLEIRYPVLEYPSKVRAHNLDKEPQLEGTLLGIKGQYLIFDTAVINVRKYSGYSLAVVGQ